MDRLLVARLSSSELKASSFAQGSSSISLVFFNNWANLVLRYTEGYEIQPQRLRIHEKD